MRGQHVERRPAAEHGGRLDHPALVGRQAVELALHELGQRPRAAAGRRGASGSSSPAATSSSSRKKGLPPVRLNRVSQTVLGSWRWYTAARNAATSGRRRRSRRSWWTWWRRSRRDEHLGGRHPPGQLVGPVGADEQQRRPCQRRRGARRRPRSRRRPSAGPRTRPARGGRRAGARWRRPRPDAGRRPRAASSPSSGLRPARRAARARRARPGRRAPRCRRAADAISSRSSRVLPMPASPATSATAGRPSVARCALAEPAEVSRPVRRARARRPPHHGRAEAGTTHEHRGRAYRRRPGDRCAGLTRRPGAGSSRYGGTGGRVACAGRARRRAGAAQAAQLGLGGERGAVLAGDGFEGGVAVHRGLLVVLARWRDPGCASEVACAHRQVRRILRAPGCLVGAVGLT